MIRRFYVLPLLPNVPDATVQEMIAVLNAADRFIPGLLDSSAGVDFHSRTVLWENTFVDEASYSGPYMVHPYHIGAIDNYVMPDSPECITDNTYATRYSTPDAAQEVRGGIRRVLLLNAATDADASALEALAAQPPGIAASAFGTDDVGWVSAKGRPWTHIWEQSFTDMAQLEHHLGTPDGIACSSVEGFASLGIQLGSLKIFTCSFELSPVQDQFPPPPPDTSPVLYTITARTAADDADAYVDLLERHYDPFMVEGGCPLLNRWRTVDQGYLKTEVHSTWQIDSLSAYSDLRATTIADPHWTAFVKEAMPLVQGGSRRIQRAERTPM
ncbi:MAG: NIPSNAP family protein, partial [bacterium]|nr:NIPSNAP family protein [bacterium]